MKVLQIFSLIFFIKSINEREDSLKNPRKPSFLLSLSRLQSKEREAKKKQFSSEEFISKSERPSYINRKKSVELKRSIELNHIVNRLNELIRLLPKLFVKSSISFDVCLKIEIQMVIQTMNCLIDDVGYNLSSFTPLKRNIILTKTNSLIDLTLSYLDIETKCANITIKDLQNLLNEWKALTDNIYEQLNTKNDSQYLKGIEKSLKNLLEENFFLDSTTINFVNSYLMCVKALGKYKKVDQISINKLKVYLFPKNSIIKKIWKNRCTLNQKKLLLRRLASFIAFICENNYHRFMELLKTDIPSNYEFAEKFNYALFQSRKGEVIQEMSFLYSKILESKLETEFFSTGFFMDILSILELQIPDSSDIQTLFKLLKYLNDVLKFFIKTHNFNDQTEASYPYELIFYFNTFESRDFTLCNYHISIILIEITKLLDNLSL